MKNIANLLFEAAMLKHLPRSGYHFLGTGKESVAEHTYMVLFIAWVMSRMAPAADTGKLLTMCLIHDLPESRIGDLNTVQKRYVHANEKAALADAVGHLEFGPSMIALVEEFNTGDTLEAGLARDADQLAFILDLKAQTDLGRTRPSGWMPNIVKRLKTDIGKKLAAVIEKTDWDTWWRQNFIDG